MSDAAHARSTAQLALCRRQLDQLRRDNRGEDADRIARLEREVDELEDEMYGWASVGEIFEYRLVDELEYQMRRRGLDPNGYTLEGYESRVSPFDRALSLAYEDEDVAIEMIRCMHRYGLDVNVPPSGEWGAWPAQHVAIAEGHPRLARLLIEYGAVVDARIPWMPYEPWSNRIAGDENTALMYKLGNRGHRHQSSEAGRRRDLDCVKLLLSRGASLELRNEHGLTAEELGRETYNDDEPMLVLLSRVRRAGGWRRYVAEPRPRVFALRALVARGRATPPRGGVLERLFGARSRVPPPVVFHVLTFWRTDRDSQF